MGRSLPEKEVQGGGEGAFGWLLCRAGELPAQFRESGAKMMKSCYDGRWCCFDDAVNLMMMLRR